MYISIRVGTHFPRVFPLAHDGERFVVFRLTFENMVE